MVTFYNTNPNSFAMDSHGAIGMPRLTRSSLIFYLGAGDYVEYCLVILHICLFVVDGCCEPVGGNIAKFCVLLLPHL